jgi:hypothetical protein
MRFDNYFEKDVSTMNDFQSPLKPFSIKKRTLYKLTLYNKMLIYIGKLKSRKFSKIRDIIECFLNQKQIT